MTQNYKVGDKVRILDASKIISGAYRGLKDGGIYEVVELYKGREYDPIVKLDDGHKFGFMDDDYNYIEKVAEDVTKFKIGDKVRILKTGAIMALIAEEGSILEVVNVDVDDGTPFLLDIDGESCCTLTSELQYIELVSDKPTKKQRLINAERSISVLESEVAELKAKVEALEKAQKPPVTTIMDAVTRFKAKPTPNEQRKAIISEAKAFVEGAKNFTGSLSGRKGYKYASTDRIVCDVEFIVNTEKRTVVALLKYQYGGHVAAKGIAKCAPDDVFNADIGKAIALGRALGLDVSKFEQAIKPTVAVGQTFKVTQQGRVTGLETVITKMSPSHDGIEGTAFRHSEGYGWLGSKQGVIIDDTEAQY